MSYERENLPVIGITVGDAAGIGPEVSLRAAIDPAVKKVCRPLLIGDLEALKDLATRSGIDRCFGEKREWRSDTLEVHDMRNLPREFSVGIDHEVTGRASAENIEEAVKLWKDSAIDAICTAPISKKAISLGGYNFPGHTEFLAALTNTSDFRMSFFAGKLRTVLLSTHVSLVDAIALVQPERVADLIRFTDRELERLLGRPVSIAVAGLNPHASEGGMFGNEEKTRISPAIETCRKEGIGVSGPYSPDTIFLRGANGEFDAVVALYHDQATIAVKSLSFGSGVNVTLGLPLIRTSVDHGTAYDIAGRGVADAASMIGAVKLAAELVESSRSRCEV